MKIQELLNIADQNRKIIRADEKDKLKLLTEAAMFFKESFIYNSNALEGYKLKLNDIKALSEEKNTAQGKSDTEYSITRGHIEAYDYMLSLLTTEEPEITEAVIRKTHYLIYCRQDQEQAGQYRTIKINTDDKDYLPPEPEDLAHLMEHFVNQMQSSRRLLHPIEYAALCHKRLMDIHPFEKCNGMVARLLMNLILISEGYGPSIILAEQRSEYLDSLRVARRKNNPDIDPLVIMVTESISRLQPEFCKAAGIKLLF